MSPATIICNLFFILAFTLLYHASHAYSAIIQGNLIIIELTMCPSDRVCGWPCVWQPTPRTADVTVTKIAAYVRVRILVNRWFFFVFLACILFTLRPICWIYELMYPADWTLHPWRHDSSNVGGVTAGQARHNSSILGVSLRARWYTTPVIIMM